MSRFLVFAIIGALLAAVLLLRHRSSHLVVESAMGVAPSTTSPARVVTPSVASDRHRTRAHPRRVISLSVTAYCQDNHRTASGVWPRRGMAAGNRWPFGTRLRVPGWGVVTITDRIGWGSDLDLFAGTDAGCDRRAVTWGRRQLRVAVLAR